MRLILRFFATARHNGADIRPYMEVIGLLVHDGVVAGAAVRDHVTGKTGEIHADLVVNAAGPWSGKVAAMAGASVPIAPSPGVLLALHGRYCNMVINRMHKSGDGDIVVPQRGLSIVGTSSWVVEDPDELSVPEDHVERMYAEGSKLIPALRHAAAPRCLVGGATAGRLRRRGHRARAVAHLPDLRSLTSKTASRGSSRSPAASPPRCAGWPSCAPMWCAASSASTSRAAPATPSCFRTPPTTPAVAA